MRDAIASQRGSIRSMATNPTEGHDRIEADEAERVFANPVIRARVEDFHARLRAGQPVRGRSHNEARHIVGLPPLPEYELDE